MKIALWILTGLNMACFGLSIHKDWRRFRNCIFLFAMLFFGFFAIGYSLENHALLYRLYWMIAVVVIPLCLASLGVLLIVNTGVLVKREGLRPKNFLSAGFGLVILCAELSMFFSLDGLALDYNGQTVAVYILFLLLYFACTFAGLLLYSWLYGRMPKRTDCDYILIHGGGLLGGDRVSPLLAGRMEKALAVWERGGRKAKLILSGGRGGDETIAEAVAMQNYMLQRRIPQDALLLEDRSTTTLENLRNSKEIMDARGADYRCIFVTSNFHVFRTGLYARKLRLKADGVGSKTALYYWPTAFIREYVAIMVWFKWAFVAYALLGGGLIVWLRSVHYI